MHESIRPQVQNGKTKEGKNGYLQERREEGKDYTEMEYYAADRKAKED